MANQNLTPYRKAIRPVMPDSFGPYVDQELDKLTRVIAEQRSAIIELQQQVAALTP